MLSMEYRGVQRTIRSTYGRGFLHGLGLVLRGELLLDLRRDCGHVHLVELGGLAECLTGFVGRVSRLQNGHFNLQASEGAFVGLAKKGRKQLGRCVGSVVGLAEVVLTQNNGQAAFVLDRGETLDHKQKIAFHQANGYRCADGAQDTQAGDLGDGFLAAALLLFGLDGRIGSGLLLVRVMNGAIWIRTNPLGFALLAAFRHNGLGRELAGLVLRPIALLGSPEERRDK